MSKYAIIETGSKQVWIEPDAVIEIEKIAVEGKDVELGQVLLARDGDRTEIGRPYVEGAKVLCEYLGEIRGPKVISFKFRRRKASRNKKGHRQNYSRLRVKEIKF